MQSALIADAFRRASILAAIALSLSTSEVAPAQSTGNEAEQLRETARITVTARNAPAEPEADAAVSMAGIQFRSQARTTGPTAFDVFFKE